MSKHTLTPSSLRAAAELVTDPTIQLEQGQSWGSAYLHDEELPEYQRVTTLGLTIGKYPREDYTVHSACTIGFVGLAMNVNPYEVSGQVCDAFLAAGQLCPHDLAEAGNKNAVVNALLSTADYLEAN